MNDWPKYFEEETEHPIVLNKSGRWKIKGHENIPILECPRCHGIRFNYASRKQMGQCRGRQSFERALKRANAGEHFIGYIRCLYDSRGSDDWGITTEQLVAICPFVRRCQICNRAYRSDKKSTLYLCDSDECRIQFARNNPFSYDWQCRICGQTTADRIKISSGVDWHLWNGSGRIPTVGNLVPVCKGDCQRLWKKMCGEEVRKALKNPPVHLKNSLRADIGYLWN